MMIDRDMKDIASQLPSSTTVLQCALRLFLDAARASGDTRTIDIGERMAEMLEPLNGYSSRC